MKTTGLDYRYSVLLISGKYFAVDVYKVKEVLNMPKLSKVPNAHQSISGVFNLRGQIYTLIDIRRFLNLEQKELSDKDYVVILEENGITFGIIVDKVIDVKALDSNKIKIPTREDSVKFIQYLEGIYQMDGKVLYLLDIPSILNAGELINF